MVGQERSQMRPHSHRADTGAASAVRDAESLVEVQVRDIRAEQTGAGDPHESVEVGAVHINLPAVAMDDVADFTNARLKDPVG